MYKNLPVMKRYSIFLILLPLIVLKFGLCDAQPIRLNPENNHYFQFKGKPTVLITSGEHYGAVVNQDFNFKLYLKTLSEIGLNHTRIFLGDYVEKTGAFCIENNTLAPGSGRFLAPWARSNVPGFSAGGNKFDLTKWNPDYFQRLHEFMQTASDMNIVVEAVLFFVGPGWDDMPMNPKNNINNTNDIRAKDYLSLNNGNILDYQKAYCLKLVRELNQYDNLILNIANEPWFNNQEHDGFASPARDETKVWINEVSDWIVIEEKNLPKKHILSVDYTNEGIAISREELEKYWKNISVFNHHYDKNAESAILNFGINRAMSFNETGLMPPVTSQYRIQGWKYLFSGGALYNNLDFTFQAGAEDGSGGTGFVCNWYNGCTDRSVKYQMKALLDFMNSFDFIRSRPIFNPTKNLVTLLFGNEQVYALEAPGQYVFYITSDSGNYISLSIKSGRYEARWIKPETGERLSDITVETDQDGHLRLIEPKYIEDIALFLKEIRQE